MVEFKINLLDGVAAVKTVTTLRYGMDPSLPQHRAQLIWQLGHSSQVGRARSINTWIHPNPNPNRQRQASIAVHVGAAGISHHWRASLGGRSKHWQAAARAVRNVSR